VSEAIPDIDLSQFLDLFIDESRGYVQTLNECLLTLEQAPDDTEALDTMFRAAHSLKGISATMGFEQLPAVAHAAEDVLHRLRDGDWSLTPELADLLFSTIDALQAMVNDIAGGGAGALDVSATLEQLRGYEPEEEAVVRPAPTGVVRVDVHHLDQLLTIATEMILHRNRLAQIEGQCSHAAPGDGIWDVGALSEALQSCDRLLGQLRSAVLQTRMVPAGKVFDRFPRMVRDLLKAEGKEADLVIEGEEVELDRTALEALSDPLVHLLRNAIDHGLETPAEREAAGKPRQGRLRLTARREHDLVVIEVSDDGRGIDARRVAAAAVERGIISAEAAAAMSEAQVLGLICHPGLSLSENVTAVSGRGVGMNVVKQAVEALRGTLQIVTQLGQGTTFQLRLPAMLALLRALLVRVGEEQYALPTAHVEHIVEIIPARLGQIGDQEVYPTAKGLLPLRRLCDLLDCPGGEEEPRHALVVRRDGQAWGLRVDGVIGHEEIVVMPLPPVLRGTPGLSGVTLVGDGRVVLILDVMGL